LHALNAGASSVHKALSRGAGAMMGDPEAMSQLGLVRNQYEEMASWWCASSARPADSKLCARRAITQQLKRGEAKAALKADALGNDSPTAHKAMEAEAKKMVVAYCK